jgi:hypothetical protein
LEVLGTVRPTVTNESDGIARQSSTPLEKAP